MERKESRNGLELIKFGAIRLKGNFGALFLGSLAMVTPLALVFLVPYLISRFTEISWIMSIGVALFAILVGPLQMGYIKYFNDAIDGKQPKVSQVYSEFKFSVFTLRTIYIALILMVLYIIGGILWIVPAGFAISFFSMTLFFLEKYKYNKLSDAMTDCARQMVGNRLAMFSYKLIFYFVYALLFGIGALCLGLIFILASDSMLVSYIVTLCSTIVFIFMYAMVTVYYHSCNQIFFEDTLMHNERKRAKLVSNKTTENKEKIDNKTDNKEIKAEDNKDNKKVDNEVDNKEENKVDNKDLGVEKIEAKVEIKNDTKTETKVETKAKTKGKPNTTTKKSAKDKPATNKTKNSGTSKKSK